MLWERRQGDRGLPVHLYGKRSTSSQSLPAPAPCWLRPDSGLARSGGSGQHGRMVKLRPETVAAASVVGEALELARAGTGVVHVKVARDVVTDTDVVIEDSVRRSLMSSFGWPVIGEERGGDAPDKGPYWLVDPICGTRNFASGIPLFSVNVALVESGEPTVAVVGDGSSGDILVAEAGNSCWSAGSGSLSRLWTSQRSLTVDFGAWPKAGAGRDRAAAQLAAAVGADRWDVRCLGTTLALAHVARGRLAGCVMFAPAGQEHTAAGVLLVREAGGKVTDARGRDWALGSEELIASADDKISHELLELLQRREVDVECSG